MRVFTLPAKRIARLLRDDGKALRELEKRGAVEILVKPEKGEFNEVELQGSSENEWLSEQVLRAIDLGFAPRIAMKLFAENNFLEIVDMGEAMHGKERAITRMKGRVIGSEGKIRKAIEEFTEASISISDDGRVGLLGGFEEVRLAKEAVLRLLEGAQHGGVLAFLRNVKRKRDAEKMGVRF